ncbi:MAG: cupin-like domain-containing protein [Gammaproteobacteria bacterium]|nr:cupin-like domain-containing protein [Gammaproteobacteria bacterium]MBU2058682.1 cupin-like domain-containing protein [Gammaproteobacteria bacterium]MBU2177352.1 cupin-like domain-containing protein [Gammaproteobacteria bacterium]MBU2246060.1 cupin-like domain-containing protein [Gammaproteobacteria bacterium]MBU2345390.1 cupin-like domain-containing protein [Gammaproteobacteria bacterium]
MKMSATQPLAQVKMLEGCDLADALALITNTSQPLVFKGLCKEWPLVQAGLVSASAAADYIRQFYQGNPVSACYIEPDQQGRVFYNAKQDGFNYQGGKIDFNQLIERLFALNGQQEVPTYYMGSTEINQWFPGLAAQNSLALEGVKPLTSVWLGNKSRIAAHYDFPQNLACNAVGHRTFTLFPPEQIANLYPGPMEFAPGGQDVSMVDFAAPDFERFPQFAEALQHAQVAHLEPGDLLFIPSMWWHHVEALDAFNVLISHWWRDSPAYLGRPNNALSMAVLSLRSLPKAQRQAWKAIFDYYIFEHDEVSQDHIEPEALKMLTKPLDELNARQIRADLQNKLKR